MIDVGSSWGRWSFAAASIGYRPIGVDPSLGAILAAKRIAAARGCRFEGIVADARYLPLRSGSIDAAFSYSVIQHFSKKDARRAFAEISRVTRQDGIVRIQMASAIGMRSFWHLMRRRLKEPANFDVRYWLPSELLCTFKAAFGVGSLEVDCYFGLGFQSTDKALYGPLGRALLVASERLRKISSVFHPLKYVADSLYLVGNNTHPPDQS